MARMRMTRWTRLLACLVAAAALLVPLAAAADEMALDRWPAERAQDPLALQRGARLFVTYCLNCHSASLMRWNRLHEIGIDDAQLTSQFIFGEQRVGDTMTVAMNSRDAKNWFGKAPPDLSVIIRARSTEEHRGTDYVYTLLRGFYRDGSTLTGWNNIAYPKIAMPNILWQRQGARSATITRIEAVEPAPGAGGARFVREVSEYGPDGSVRETKSAIEQGAPGMQASFSPVDPKAAAATDEDVADLVAFLNWMSEPTAAARIRIGYWAMGFLVVFLLVARWLNNVYWRDVR
jgi:ubiquinol-cytochrome c reductase cytochrome c1 subunit